MRDRDGSLIELDIADSADTWHRCYGGWLSTPDEDKPRPCTTCRPWLRERRPPTRAELPPTRRRRVLPAAR